MKRAKPYYRFARPSKHPLRDAKRVVGKTTLDQKTLNWIRRLAFA